MNQTIPSIEVSSLRDKVDVVILTIRGDEFLAVLQRFPVQLRVVGSRHYDLSYVNGLGDTPRCVAIVRCGEQGGGVAQAVAQDVINELRPHWLLIVGIAGGRPSEDFGPGDVVVSTHVHDFSVEAVLQTGEHEYNLGGGPLQRQASAAAANFLALMQSSQWNSPEVVRSKRPVLEIADDRLEGPEDWKKQGDS